MDNTGTVLNEVSLGPIFALQFESTKEIGSSVEKPRAGERIAKAQRAINASRLTMPSVVYLIFRNARH